MERNRMKALSLKRARLTARTTEKPNNDAKAADRSVQSCHSIFQSNFNLVQAVFVLGN